MGLDSGQRVRLKTAPDVIGRLTGQIEHLGPLKRYEVEFESGDGREFIAEGNLDVIQSKPSISNLVKNKQFGRPANLRTIISHARLTGKLADVIYSMEATNTDFYPYQFKPVLNFLESPSNGLLIADEVGLGKTIEAGLIWTELRARFDANRLLVVCPAVLVEKWVFELNERFGVRSKSCDASELAEYIRDPVSSKEQGFALVCSLQGIRPARNYDDPDNQKPSAILARILKDHSIEQEVFDCVIIDEAHYLRNASTQTHELGMLLRAACTYMLLLSATPIQIKSEDLFHLLHVLDNENFKYKTSFQEVLAANGPIVAFADEIRRGGMSASRFTESLEVCMNHRLFNGNRQLSKLLSEPPSSNQLADIEFRALLSNRIERINLLGSVINRTRKRDVNLNRVQRVPVAMSIPLNEIEQEFYDSVTNAVSDYCVDYDLHEGFLLTIPQRQMCSSMPAALRDWQRKSKAHQDTFSTQEIKDLNELPLEEWSDRLLLNKNKTLGPLTLYLSSLSQTIAGLPRLC